MLNTSGGQKRKFRRNKELKHLMKNSVSRQKDKYFEDKDSEVLNKMHSQLLFEKVKDQEKIK